MLVYIKPLSMFPKVHSDKLFGAFLSAMSELFPSKINDLIDKFDKNEPPFLISSMFPVLYINNRKMRFFPKIILEDNFINFNQSIVKDFKKVEYLEEGLFFEIINGNLSHKDILINYSKYVRINNLLMSKDFKVNINIVSNLTPHNSINRLSNETKVFFNEGLCYGKEIGLFFFIDFLDESYKSVIKSCLKFLQDRGLGKDISTGKGQFEFEIEDIDMNFDNEIKMGDKFVTLSRFIPSEDDLKHIDNDSYYEIQSKRSIDKSGEIRKQVHFFKEGSVFLHYKKFYGKTVNVGNLRPAIEYGYAFPIKFVKER